MKILRIAVLICYVLKGLNYSSLIPRRDKKKSMQPTDTDFIGAVKIKDGLFMGDGYAAQVKSPSFSLF